MKSAEPKTTSATIQRKAAGPFFGKGNESFFKAAPTQVQTPFFTSKANTPSGNSTPVQAKSNTTGPIEKSEKEADTITDTTAPLQAKFGSCGDDGNLIQRQEHPDNSVTNESSPNPDPSPTANPIGPSPRAGRCLTDPAFPDFKCLGYALKLDIDDNLWANAHRFYQVATLHPGDNQLMLDTFLRYGVGVNLLKTSFGFMGANNTTANILSYGTGIALKSYDFLSSGQLKLDVPIPIGKGVNLDIKFDLNADPKNLSNIQGADAEVGISGHF